MGEISCIVEHTASAGDWIGIRARQGHRTTGKIIKLGPRPVEIDAEATADVERTGVVYSTEGAHVTPAAAADRDRSGIIPDGSCAERKVTRGVAKRSLCRNRADKVNRP